METVSGENGRSMRFQGDRDSIEELLCTSTSRCYDEALSDCFGMSDT